MNQHLQHFFETTPDPLVVTDGDGRMQEFNPAWIALVGLSAAELRGRALVEVLHPEARDAALRAVELSQTGVEAHFEGRCLGQDDGARPFAWTLRAADGQCYMRGRERSAEHELRAEAARHRVESQRFRALADTTSDFVGIADLQGRALYVNPAGLRLVGRTALEMGAMQISEFHPPEHAAFIASTGIPRAIEFGVWTCEGQLRSVDGGLIPVSQVIVALRDGEGELEALGTIIRDLSVIAQLKTLEQDLRGQQATLREALLAMSTPIIPITEHIVVMPLVGSLDPQRAEQFFEAALHGAQAHQARVVIIDVTGLVHVNAGIASTLVKISKALRLLGAQVVLTGIHATIARTLIDIGAELDSLIPYGTLQSGFNYALGLVGEGPGRGARQR